MFHVGGHYELDVFHGPFSFTTFVTQITSGLSDFLNLLEIDSSIFSFLVSLLSLFRVVQYKYRERNYVRTIQNLWTPFHLILC